MTLVLSLFPGIGLLDKAFEEAGFCVVRGPDAIWGGDIRAFHPPSGRFDGVVGGPPCQAFSMLVNIVRAVHGPDSVAEDLIPEFARCILEARPAWFLMENVPAAPSPEVGDEYGQHVFMLNNRWVGGVQNRLRRFVWGARRDSGVATRLLVRQAAFESIDWEPAVLSKPGGRRAAVAIGGSGKPKPFSPIQNRSVGDMLELQGLSRHHLDECPLTVSGKKQAIANGVPLFMGRALAAAIIDAIGGEAR